ncbi:MAG: GerMN domain-containing protein [Firmicutes bacterium]|nr:GerMN domain-containing protein [Bacillota bacterium]
MAQRGESQGMQTIALILSLAALIVAGLAYVAVRDIRGEFATLDRRVAGLEQDVADLGGRIAALPTRAVTIYLEKHTPTDMFLVPVARTTRGDEPGPLAALRALLAGPLPEETDLTTSIPRGVQVRSVSVENGTATADFSAALTRPQVGSQGEAMIVGSIVNTLTEFPDVDRVQILVDGARVESIAGHIDVSRPLTRDPRLIRAR